MRCFCANGLCIDIIVNYEKKIALNFLKYYIHVIQIQYQLYMESFVFSSVENETPSFKERSHDIVFPPGF